MEMNPFVDRSWTRKHSEQAEAHLSPNALHAQSSDVGTRSQGRTQIRLWAIPRGVRGTLASHLPPMITQNGRGTEMELGSPILQNPFSPARLKRFWKTSP